jgi:glutamine--fructose-6-phosphate transaminase (isomerizing)
VASTKAFTGQVTVLMLLALCVGQMRGTVDDATVERIVRELKNMPLYILKSASNLNGNLNCSKELEHYAS